MRIAYVIGQLGVGGAERQLLRKGELFRENGVELTIIALSEGGQLAAAYTERGLAVHQLERHGSQDLRRVRRLAGLLRELRPHVVHGEQYDAGTYARTAGVLARVPVRVLAVRSAYPSLRRAYRITERVLKHFTDGYIVNAEAIKQRTIAFHGVPADRVFVHYNVFDDREKPRRSPEDVRRELGLHGNELVFGHVASFSPEKNHLLFLDFARGFVDERPDARFLLVGDGEERPGIEAAIERHGLGDRVHLLGMRRDVPDLLSIMDVSVNTSVREGLCNALLESLAAGVPVLATRVGGTPELVREARHGELFPSGSIGGMTDAARRLVADLDEYRARVRAERDEILSPFQENRVIRETIQTYQTLLARRGLAPSDD